MQPTNKYRIYRSMLRFYPSQFRSDYADQMIVTLDDMLEDCETIQARIMVWLRVAIELPVSAIQERIHTKEDTNMDKLSKVSNKKLFIGGIVVLLLIIFLVSGIFRSKIAAGIADMIYQGKLNQVVDQQRDILDDPLKAMGVTRVYENNSCNAYADSLLNPQITVLCNAGRTGRVTLGETENDKVRNIAIAQTVEATLLKNGYQSGSNGVTLSGLVAGTYNGKDNSPDAFYRKVVGRYVCTVDTFIAYSNPAPKAITSSLTCDRNLAPFGSSQTDTSGADNTGVVKPQTVAQAKAAAPRKLLACDTTSTSKAFRPGELEALETTLLGELTDVPAGTKADITVSLNDSGLVAGSVVYPKSFGAYNFQATKSVNQDHTNEVWTIQKYIACKPQ